MVHDKDENALKIDFPAQGNLNFRKNRKNISLTLVFNITCLSNKGGGHCVEFLINREVDKKD
jgi:hypothetical protein